LAAAAEFGKPDSPPGAEAALLACAGTLASNGAIDFAREGFRLQFVSELPELIHVYARPKSERMRDRLRGGPAPSTAASPKPARMGAIQSDAIMLQIFVIGRGGFDLRASCFGRACSNRRPSRR